MRPSHPADCGGLPSYRREGSGVRSQESERHVVSDS
jgi:hypothetical protein